MARTVARTVIAAPPESVWSVLTHHEGMPAWSPLRRVVLEAEGAPDRDGVGAIRAMHAAGPVIKEKVVAWDPPRSYDYTLIAGAPIRDHVGRVELTPVPGGTGVTWTVDFRPRVPGTGGAIAALLGRALQGMLDRLRDRLEAEAAGLPADAARVPALYRLLLYRPRQIRRSLIRLYRAGLIDQVPTLWQVTLGVLYMWHRILFRAETIGVGHEPVRPTRRARLLEHKPLRLPFLLGERAITPLDFTGFASGPERIICHLLGAYHPGDNFVYDLQTLSANPGALDELRQRVAAVVDSDDARSRWLRDLAVYDGYHERLLSAVDRALAGNFSVGDEDNADTTVPAFVAWCAAQPATPAASLRVGVKRLSAGRAAAEQG